MTMTAEVQEIFSDARAMHGQAIARLEARDIRDAAEKAWCATLGATNALVLARTGELPEKSPATTIALDELAETTPQVKALVGRYFSRQETLHGKCFCLGLCEPLPTIERRIRETSQYIEDAEALA